MREILTHHSVGQYKHSHRLQFIPYSAKFSRRIIFAVITVLHFGVPCAIPCATHASSPLLAVWLDPVIQSSNPVCNPVHNPVQQLETACLVRLYSLSSSLTSQVQLASLYQATVHLLISNLFYIPLWGKVWKWRWGGGWRGAPKGI